MSDINKLTRGLDFFNEYQKDLNSDSKSNTIRPVSPVVDVQGNYEEIERTAEFLDRMGTLDCLENTVNISQKEIVLIEN